jgi:plastocyanin
VVLNAAGPVAWSSDAPAVATVDSAGVVRAVATGTATISATVQGVSGSRLVTVLPSGIGAVVTMPGFSFVPYQVTIRAGQQVYFEFPQTPHNVIFNRKPGAPADIQETRNRSVARQFDVAGSFEYDCTLHPGMSGLVVVNP